MPSKSFAYVRETFLNKIHLLFYRCIDLPFVFYPTGREKILKIKSRKAFLDFFFFFAFECKNTRKASNVFIGLYKTDYNMIFPEISGHVPPIKRT